MANDSRLICAFGVIADVQYADIDDGMNFQRTRHRYYRRSLELVKTALRDWSTGQYRAEFVLQLGDLIDGRNARFGVSRLALDTVVSELIKCGHFVYHVIGNHDLYNLSHDELLTCDLLKASFINEAGISTPSPGSTGYYHFVPAEGFRIVVMDNYEISMLGQDETSDSYREAKDILTKHNSNEELNSLIGLLGSFRRFVKYNGGVSADQLRWLDDVLQKCDENHEIVLVAGHIPVYFASSDGVCMVWNFEDVLKILHKHRCVLAYLAGHTHCYGYSQDKKGIHHVVFPAVVEATPKCLAKHVTFLLYSSRVVIKASEDSSMSDIIMDVHRDGDM